MDSIKVILERTPPELAADIIKNGIYVSGGTSISEIWRSLSIETNLAVNIVENPAESVVGLMGVVSNRILPVSHTHHRIKITTK